MQWVSHTYVRPQQIKELVAALVRDVHLDVHEDPSDPEVFRVQMHHTFKIRNPAISNTKQEIVEIHRQVQAGIRPIVDEVVTNNEYKIIRERVSSQIVKKLRTEQARLLCNASAPHLLSAAVGVVANWIESGFQRDILEGK